MCRIAGIVSNRPKTTETVDKVSIMCKALQHGGPDDEGIYSAEENKVIFGHRRLAIIDLSSNGHQPMADARQHAWISFNGEIYNYPELKRELLLEGAKLKSDTDTEVIIAAYLRWGTNAFAKLRGMFAFALYDVGKSLVYLVRDTTGVKPLYYHINNGELSFASEVKALKAAGVAAEADPNWIVRFLAFGHLPEPYTTLKNVFSLPKGSFLSWNNNTGDWQIDSYQKKSHHPLISNIPDAINNINTTLKMAMKRQLIADAPIGVFLSGGLDSSLITLLANQEKGPLLNTVSIFFNEKSYDEREYQQIILNNIAGEKFSHLIKQQEFEIFFPQILESMDLPTTDGINTWFISKYAHEDGLKAVLSGLGADELFGGYPSFNRIKYLRYLRMLPATLLKRLSSIVPDPYKKISFLTHDDTTADYLFLRGLFTLADIAGMLDADVKEVEAILFNSAIGQKSVSYDKTQAAWFEENLYMQNQLLRDTDVMSMSHGLEVRVPFLDEDFQETVKNISPDIRFGSRPKKLLIDSFTDYLPDAIRSRSKMGFTFPLQQWMADFDEITGSFC